MDRHEAMRRAALGEMDQLAAMVTDLTNALDDCEKVLGYAVRLNDRVVIAAHSMETIRSVRERANNALKLANRR